MRVLSYLFAVIVFLLAGCGIRPADDPTLLMHGDVQYNTNERDCIEKASAQWAEQTSGVAVIDVVWDYNSLDPQNMRHHAKDHRIVRWTSKTQLVVEEEKEQTEACMDETGQTEEQCSYTLLGQVSPGSGIHNAPIHIPVEMRLVADRLTDPLTCKNTALHEFGHVLGLPHITSNKASIMYPSINPQMKGCLSYEDLMMFCFKNDCGQMEMKPCQLL